MAKRRLKLRVRIPPYTSPRNKWRHQIHRAVLDAARDKGIQYQKDDRLELNVVLYLPKVGLRFHDVDNRLKDVMDALQGRAGGTKGKRKLEAIVPDDHQVFKVTVEKRLPSPQSHGAGHLIIRRYTPSTHNESRQR